MLGRYFIAALLMFVSTAVVADERYVNIYRQYLPEHTSNSIPLYSRDTRNLKIVYETAHKNTTPGSVSENDLYGSVRDFNQDGIPEVVVKNSGQCIAPRTCHISIMKLADDKSTWELMFDAYGERVFTGVKSDTFRVIILDGAYETTEYEYSVDDHAFKLISEEIKTPPVAWENLTNEQTLTNLNVISILMRDFGSLKDYLEQQGQLDSIVYHYVDLSRDSNSDLMLRVNNSRHCTEAGCPIYIYMDLNKKPYYAVYVKSDDIRLQETPTDALPRIYEYLNDDLVKEFVYRDGTYQ